MQSRSTFKVGVLLACFILWLPSVVAAQEETATVTASGFGSTREAALDQAAYHAVLRVVEKKFAGHPEYTNLREDIRQFVKENMSGFVEDLSDVKIIKKYRRNKITARIPVNAAEVISAVQGQFPDLTP